MSNNMNSKKYPTYKDSGIEWIGKIPAEWEVIKLKYIMQNFDGKRIPLSSEQRAEMRGDYPYYGSNGIVDHVNDYLFDGEYILLGEDGAPFFEAYKDVAFFMRGKFWVNNHAHILKAFKGHDQKFLTYALNCVEYRRYITGSTRDKLTQDDMSSIELPIPKDVEQKAIADCLDRKTAQIDELVIKKERMIDFLKEERTAIINQAVTKGLDTKVEMKDSGIEWLNKIPRHWKLNKLKHATYIKGRVGWQALTTNEYITEGPYLVTGTDFLDGEICWDDCFHVSQERYDMDPYIQLRNGDLLITKDGTIGKVAVVKSMPRNSTLNSGVFLTRPTAQDIYLSDYMYWVLNSAIFSNFIDYTKKGSTISHLYQEVFREFVYPTPNLKEQRQIVGFLSNKTKEIDSLVAKYEKQILYLKEYYTSLISETVTGKIDVREAVKC